MLFFSHLFLLFISAKAAVIEKKPRRKMSNNFAIAIVDMLMSIVGNLMGCYFQNGAEEESREQYQNWALHFTLVQSPAFRFVSLSFRIVAREIYLRRVFVIAGFSFLIVVVHSNFGHVHVFEYVCVRARKTIGQRKWFNRLMIHVYDYFLSRL